eukprot:scaffold327_cov257-Pinguiococcus_pyrenoidosus.AAC.8
MILFVLVLVHFLRLLARASVVCQGPPLGAQSGPDYVVLGLAMRPENGPQEVEAAHDVKHPGGDDLRLHILQLAAGPVRAAKGGQRPQLRASFAAKLAKSFRSLFDTQKAKENLGLFRVSPRVSPQIAVSAERSQSKCVSEAEPRLTEARTRTPEGLAVRHAAHDGVAEGVQLHAAGSAPLRRQRLQVEGGRHGAADLRRARRLRGALRETSAPGSCQCPTLTIVA